MAVAPEVEGFFDPAGNTIVYIVKDTATGACAIIHSVLEVFYAAGRITYDSADRLIGAIRGQGLSLKWIIQPQVHADHLCAAPHIQDKLGGKTGVGAGIKEIQGAFGKIFNEGTEYQRDGSHFDALFEGGDTYTSGGINACPIRIIARPAFLQKSSRNPITSTKVRAIKRER